LQCPVGLGGIVQRAIAAFEPAQAGEAVGDTKRLGDRQAAIHALGEHADRARALHRSAASFDVAGDQAQQRGLAAAVAADNAGPLRADRERQAVE
jgi:hypothetical protein